MVHVCIPLTLFRGSANTLPGFATSIGLSHRTTVGHGNDDPFPISPAPFLSLPPFLIPSLLPLSPVLVVWNNFARHGSRRAVEVVHRLLESGVYARVVGDVAYVMVSPTTPMDACGELMASVTSVIRGLGEEGDGGAALSRADAVAYNI